MLQPWTAALKVGTQGAGAVRAHETSFPCVPPARTPLAPQGSLWSAMCHLCTSCIRPPLTHAPLRGALQLQYPPAKRAPRDQQEGPEGLPALPSQAHPHVRQPVHMRPLGTWSMEQGLLQHPLQECCRCEGSLMPSPGSHIIHMPAGRQLLLRGRPGPSAGSPLQPRALAGPPRYTHASASLSVSG